MRKNYRVIACGALALGLLSACGGDAKSGGSAGASGVSAGAGGQSGSGQQAGSGGAPIAGAAGAAGAGAYPSIEIGPQVTSTKLDVLFVVDNSVSMAGKQATLAASVPAFVARLTNPWCVDAQGKPTPQQPASGSAACVSGTREITPVTDVHFGVISTSLGSHGGQVCSRLDDGSNYDDQAQLIPSKRTGLASYQSRGYLAYDAAGIAGVADAAAVALDLQATILGTGERGCGYEAPLEAMYRFLVDPEPPLSIKLENQVSTPTGVNEVLLTQRKSFLRPDSAVAIVLLSDENDCSIIDTGLGWFAAAETRLPLATEACVLNPNDPCCRSCATYETAPPKGCAALTADSVCKNVTAGQAFATYDVVHDSLNLRCFQQQKRFGFDLLYPVERYADALTNPRVRNRADELVDNPLLAARDGKGPRSASLISVSMIGGVPWQDLATTASLQSQSPLEYLDGAGLASQGRWALVVGDPAKNVSPSDPFMLESVEARSGTNPLTNTPMTPAASMNPQANPINGHEQNIPDLADLQYACTFPFATPVPCEPGSAACECAPDKSGDTAAVVAANSPLCQPPAGGAPTTTQYYGKAYPTVRELSLVRALGDRGVAASICPKEVSNMESPDYGYRPAFTSLLRRIAKTVR